MNNKSGYFFVHFKTPSAFGEKQDMPQLLDPSRGVSQEALRSFPEGEQDQPVENFLELDYKGSSYPMSAEFSTQNSSM